MTDGDEVYCDACFHDGPLTHFEGQVWSWNGEVVEEKGDFCELCYWQVEYYSLPGMTREGWEHDQQLQAAYEAERFL
jgi:hypothetical protein